jgi:hypothetical protein
LKFRLGETVVDKRTTLFVVIIGCQEQLNRLPIYQVLEPRSKNIFIRKEFDLMPQDPTGPTDPSGGVPLPKFTSREIAALKRLINATGTINMYAKFYGEISVGIGVYLSQIPAQPASIKYPNGSWRMQPLSL